MGKICLILVVWMAAVTARQEDWPPDTQLERTPACPTAVLLIEPSHEDAETAVWEFAATMTEEPGARGHVVVLAGQGPVASRVWRALRTLPRTEVHFVQDDAEVAAFGVTNGLGMYVFDAWGHLKKQDDRSTEAPVVLGSYRNI